MGWSTFKGNVRGTLALGDKTVPATKWWNHLYLLFFVWKTVTVFRPKCRGSYRIGYIPLKGNAKILDDCLLLDQFAVRNGNEECVFFAIAEDGTEIELEVVERTTIDKLGGTLLL